MNFWDRFDEIMDGVRSIYVSSSNGSDTIRLRFYFVSDVLNVLNLDYSVMDNLPDGSVIYARPVNDGKDLEIVDEGMETEKDIPLTGRAFIIALISFSKNENAVEFTDWAQEHRAEIIEELKKYD